MMIKVALVGYGKMGRQVEMKIKESENVSCVGIVDPTASDMAKTLDELKNDFNVIIDFSHPDNLEMIGGFAKSNNVAVVIATTGYEEAQIKYIKELSEFIPVVYTANFSLGITVMTKLVTQMSEALSDAFDIEIIEMHHNQKIDAPSGTAKMLMKAVDPDDEYIKVFGRQGYSKRKKEIGVHAIRGGNISGTHTVLFAGEDETLEITHKANSKQIFANGAIKAAMFASENSPGLYDMNDVLFG